MVILETGVYIFFVLATFFTLVVWLVKRKNYSSREFYDTKEVVTLYTLPRAVIVWTAMLVAFFLIDLNKLNLLYIFPLIYLAVNIWQTKRVIKEDNERSG